MATTKSAGSTRLGRDSQSKRLGIKLFAGEKVQVGNILVRQRGGKFLPGKNVKMGKDHTLYSMAEGTVTFGAKTLKKFNGRTKQTRLVSVLRKTTSPVPPLP